jgi:hypothetical protein
MTYQVLTCPNCGGKGCPTCQNTGKVRVNTEQLQKIKTLAKQLGQAMPESAPGQTPASPLVANPVKSPTNLAGIITFSILAVLAGAGAASWYFLKSFRPFVLSLVALLTLIGARFAWKLPFFALQEPDDFLKAIKK